MKFPRLSILALVLFAGCATATTQNTPPACMTAEQYFGQGAQGVDCTRTLTKDFPQEVIVTCFVGHKDGTISRVRRLDRRCW